MRILSLCVAIAVFVTGISANALPTKKEAENKNTSITIYSKAGAGSISPSMYRPTPNNYGWTNASSIPGYALIRQERDVYLQKDRQMLMFDDSAAYIDPTTVTFKSLTDPEHTSAIEQNFYFDLVSPQKLAERYVGETISIEKNFKNKDMEIFSGQLLSTSGNQLSVEKEDGSIVSASLSDAIFPALPGGLFTKPTLALDVVSKQRGKHRIETSYQTEGMTWWSDYNAVYSDGKNENEGYLDIGAWVSIVNKSGADYGDTKLKLIAGDVNRVTPQSVGRNYKAMAMESLADASNVAGFAEKSFFEFHLYTLGRPTSLPNNSTKQIELFEQANHVPVEKLLMYNGNLNRYYGGTNTDPNFGQQSNKKVDVYLKFKNDKAHGLGIPLPAGRVRVSKRDMADDSLEFIGEDTIDHTSKDEEIKLKLGKAFDVVGQRKQSNFYIDHRRKYMSENIEISVSNHKNEAVDVLVVENLNRGVNWTIEESSMSYEKLDSRTLHFPLSVPAGETKNIRYKVGYSW